MASCKHAGVWKMEDEELMEEWLENDEISPEEEGFMRGEWEERSQ